MPIQNVNRVKEIAFSPSARGNTKRTRSTMPLKTPFRHLTQFPLNNPLYLLRITIESVTANGSMSALGQKRTFSEACAMSALPPTAGVSRTSHHATQAVATNISSSTRFRQ
jgi:hypothetical protein